MPQSVHSGGSGSSILHRYVHVVLLSKKTVVVPVESKNTKVQDIFSKICDLLNLRETEFFGLALLKENEFQFLERDLKVSKLTSKIWKSKESSTEEPLQTFYLRVQYYVENVGLLKEKTTRLQYYLQMKDNLLHYGQSVAEEKCFLLASYALQADHGDYVAANHGDGYFDPREYFPASVVMRRGQDYITTHLPVMHKSMAGIPATEARVNYIVELSTSPNAHNFHFYKMRKRKYDTAAIAWVAICPAGLGIYEESDGFRYPVTVFRWPDIGKLHYEKKKFEIISEGTAGPKYTFYFDCKEWAEYIVDLCRQVHQFHLKLQPQLTELQNFHTHDLRFSEKYVYSENSECTLDRHQSLTWIGPGDRAVGSINEQLVGSSSVKSASSAQQKESSLNSFGREEQEIFITTPPRIASINSLPFELPHQPQSFEGHYPEKLRFQETEVPQRRLVFIGSGNGDGREAEYSVGNIPAAFASYSLPASSSESLAFMPFMKADGLRQSHSEFSSSATSSGTQSQAPSALTTPSQRSASPNSSAGSGQLPLSLPISRDVYDAAFLRQSLPHGVHFNDYLQKLWSGQEVASNSASVPRKSSFDRLQLSQNRFMEPVQRSKSLRQPLVNWDENRKGSKPLSQGETGLSVMRSNSDKTQKSSKLALLPEFLGTKSAPQQGTREVPAPAAFALPSGTVTVARSDSNKSQNLSIFSASSDQMLTLPGGDLATVSRSDSNKSQKSILAPCQSAVLLGDGTNSQKSGFPLPSDVYIREEGHSIVQKREDGQFAAGGPYPIIPVDAQIQRLVFGPTMTAVSTPVRPAAEKPIGSLPTLPYQSPYAYIPDSFPASVIRPSLRAGPGILSVPHQDVVAVTIPSEILFQNSGSAYPSHLENRPYLQLPSNYLSNQALVPPEISAGELADGDYHERPSPPPYGAFHSTVSGVQFQNPVQTQEPQQTITPFHQMTPMQHSQVTVAKPFPTKQHQQKTPTSLDYVMSSAAGRRELSSWLMVNSDVVNGQQKQADGMNAPIPGSASNLNRVDQNDSSGSHRLKKSMEIFHEGDGTQGHLEQSNKDRKSEVTRHVSDRHPGYHDPQCPRHGISSDIRERLRSLGPSVPPMLNALLTDKSLRNNSCTCLDNHADRRIVAAHSSDALNLSGLSLQQHKGHNGNQNKLRYFPDLSLESDATMIINGTMTSNGTSELEEVDDTSERHERLFSSAARRARPNMGRRFMNHSSDSKQRPQPAEQRGHNQSNSDSAIQNFVSSEC